MFKVGDILKGIKDSNDGNVGTRLLKAEVIELICNGEELLLQILEHCDDSKVGIVFKAANSKEYLKLVDDKIRIEDVGCLIEDSYKDEVNQKEELLREIVKNKESARRKFAKIIKDEEQLKIEIEKLKSTNSIMSELSKKIFEELQMIEKDEKCEKIEINSEIIDIFTTQLYIEDDKYPEGHFKMNKYHIKIKLDELRVEVYGILSEFNRRSCWSSECPHPHVSNLGNPCWGNSEPMLMDTMGNKELYTTFMVVINFLETFNIDDDAGVNIKNWDFVSFENDDVVLENPYNNDQKLDCGCVVDGNDDDNINYCSICENTMCEECYMYCEICSSTICSEHSEYIEYEGERVCTNCKEEKFVYAQDIGGYARKENTFKCDECGETFTADVEKYSEYEEESVCPSCKEEHFIYLESVDDYARKENVFTCDECGNTFTNDDEQYSEYEGQSVCKCCAEEKFVYVKSIEDYVRQENTFLCDECDCHFIKDENEDCKCVCDNCCSEEYVE